MDKLSDLYKHYDVEDESLRKKKTELSNNLDETLIRGNVSSDVLLLMKEMVDGLKPVITMEDYIDDLG